MVGLEKTVILGNNLISTNNKSIFPAGKTAGPDSMVGRSDASVLFVWARVRVAHCVRIIQSAEQQLRSGCAASLRV